MNIVKVENGSAGQSPTVTFTLRDGSGKGIPIEQMTATPNRVGLVLAGPTVDYGYTNLGAATSGYISEDPSRVAKCSADGTCTYTFNAKIPADAKGTYTVGIEARRGITLLPGTKKETASQYGAINKVMHFSVDGSPVARRRQVVSIDKCNQCHGFLALHGENRNQIEQCVLCHNAERDGQGSARRRGQPRRQGATAAVGRFRPHDPQDSQGRTDEGREPGLHGGRLRRQP